MVSQRLIYDARYAESGYDTRSKIRVLSAEAKALEAAVLRAAVAQARTGTLSIFDFGYGTGRVTNEFLLQFPSCFQKYGPAELHVIAYDVSVVGLRKAKSWLVEEHAFADSAPFSWKDDEPTGYIAGSITRAEAGATVTVTFVHGSEDDPADVVADLIRKANHGHRVGLSTSWYSGLGHIRGERRRAEFFKMFDDVGDRTGEILIATSVSGDLVDAQRAWAEKLARGEHNGYPIEVPGDVMYVTELGQDNYYHVFGPDLAALLDSITHPGQASWIEAIRFPDEEFETVEAEQANYKLVVAFNREKARTRWTTDDYGKVHTAAAIRTGSAPGTPSE